MVPCALLKNGQYVEWLDSTTAFYCRVYGLRSLHHGVNTFPQCCVLLWLILQVFLLSSQPRKWTNFMVRILFQAAVILNGSSVCSCLALRFYWDSCECSKYFVKCFSICWHYINNTIHLQSKAKAISIAIDMYLDFIELTVTKGAESLGVRYTMTSCECQVQSTVGWCCRANCYYWFLSTAPTDETYQQQQDVSHF